MKIEKFEDIETGKEARELVNGIYDSLKDSKDYETDQTDRINQTNQVN